MFFYISSCGFQLLKAFRHNQDLQKIWSGAFLVSLDLPYALSMCMEVVDPPILKHGNKNETMFNIYFENVFYHFS